MAAYILAGMAILALSKSRPRVSSSALTSLGQITDTRYFDLQPSALLAAVEITSVSILESPVIVGSYPKLWIYLKANSPSPILGDFCRIYDDETGVLVGEKKNWLAVFTGNEWIAKYDGFDDWNSVMPNKTWKLRIEVGTN